MKLPPTITVIGAASTTFGPKVLSDLVNHPQLNGATVRLVDINADRLQIYERLAHRLCENIEHGFTFEATADRRAALSGSDYVLIAVDIRHYELWQQDFAIPARHGIRQVTGELGGPGGMFHSLRQIPLHLEIARDIAELAPQAMVLVMSNPLNRICLAMRRHSDVGQIVGLCHGVEITHEFVFSEVLKIDGADIGSTAAGTNHFTWILDVWRQSTGEDLYPSLHEKLKGFDPKREALSRKLYEVYGYYPACGDGHMGEYVPYAWEFVGIEGPPFERMKKNEDARWERLDLLSRGEPGSDGLGEFLRPRSWVDTLAFPIMASIASNTLHRMPAVNMLNNGTISNLPADVFVETPGIVDASGVRPLHIGELPKELAAFNRRDVEQTELTVEAAVTGDRRRLLQAMLLDPVVDSVAAAERITDEMLRAQKDFLPQF